MTILAEVSALSDVSVPSVRTDSPPRSRSGRSQEKKVSLVVASPEVYVPGSKSLAEQPLAPLPRKTGQDAIDAARDIEEMKESRAADRSGLSNVVSLPPVERSLIDPDDQEEGGHHSEGTAATPAVAREETIDTPVTADRIFNPIPPNNDLLQLVKGLIAASMVYGSHWGPPLPGSRRFYLAPAPWSMRGGENTPLAGRRLAFPPDDEPFSAAHPYASRKTTIGEADYERMGYELAMARCNPSFDRCRLALGAYNAGGCRGLT